MASISDFNKLSTYVNGIIDRKVRSMTLGLITLTTKLKSFQSGSNEKGFWEKRPNIIEQWGIKRFASTSEPVVDIQLPIAMPDGTYTVALTPFINVANLNYDTWVQSIQFTKGTTSFQVQYQATTASVPALDGVEWRIIGYVA